MSIKEREVELKREQDPKCDVTEDEYEIAQQRKYLVYDPTKWFYLDRKNHYPLRNSAQANHDYISPTVSKARHLIQDMTNHRRIQEIRSANNPDRKSAYSVRFQPGEYNDEPQNVLVRGYSVKSPYRDTTQTPAEQMLDRLRRKKKKGDTNSPFSILLDSRAADEDEEIDIPDDYTQVKQVTGLGRSKSLCLPGGRANQSGDESDDDMSTSVPDYTVKRPTASAISRGATSMVSKITLPNVEEDVPNHELQLLRASPTKRFVHSAGGRRLATDSQPTRQKNRLVSSHAAARYEREHVQQKVEAFLQTLDKESTKKKTWHRHTTTPAQALVRQKQAELDLIAKKTLPLETSKTKSEITPGTPKQNITSRATGPTEKKPTTPKQGKGIPGNSMSRSKGIIVAVRLQKIIKAFKDKCTTRELMEMERLKKEMQEGKTDQSQ